MSVLEWGGFIVLSIVVLLFLLGPTLRQAPCNREKYRNIPVSREDILAKVASDFTESNSTLAVGELERLGPLGENPACIGQVNFPS
jgi:hypothetical protein